MKTKLLLFRYLLMITVWFASCPRMVAGNQPHYQYNVNCATSPTGYGSVYINGGDVPSKEVSNYSVLSFSFQVGNIPNGYFLLGWSKDKEATNYSDILSADNPYSVDIDGYYLGEFPFPEQPDYDENVGEERMYYANMTSVKVQSLNETEGTASIMDSPVQVLLGTQVRLLAAAEYGYRFKEWRKDDVLVSSDNPFNFTPDETTAGVYTAVFEESDEVTDHNVIIYQHSHGNFSPDKTTATAGQDVTLNVSSDDGYETVEVRYNNIVADKVNDVTYVFTMPNADAYVSQKCAPIIYTISYDLNGGTATGNPTSFTVETETFTLNPPTKEGYTFAGWRGSGIAEPLQTVTITKGSTDNRTYTAVWTAND